jgi:microsomal dipeptidase-like Zn-dependent dipeptidase
MSQGPPPIGKEFEYWLANQLLNYQGGVPRVSLDKLLAGAEGGIASVLYDPDDEFFHDATPIPDAFPHLIAQMDQVENEVAGKIRVVRNPVQLADALSSHQKFLLHCVEGAFALGGNPVNADKLAARGVAYVVIAHLFFRGVAACQNAFPFVPDSIFRDVLNPAQPANSGLTPLGRDIVDRLMTAEVLVDITHSNEQAQKEIFQLARDHNNVPVISSHTGIRGVSDYPLNLSADAIKQIAALKGVIGIILAPYWLRQPDHQVFGADNFDLVFAAIDGIHDLTGTYNNIAIGSDLDGFIHPIKDCPDYSRTPALVAAIRAKYPQAADLILWRNALDVLQRGWRGIPS